MNIGQAARHSGMSAKMIRYYEKIGVLPLPKRTDTGYRDYSEADLRQLIFIQHARELGFSSEQLKELLSLWLNDARQSIDVKQLAQKHITFLQERIHHMQSMVYFLQQAVDQCAGNTEANCMILRQIESGIDSSQICCAEMQQSDS